MRKKYIKPDITVHVTKTENLLYTASPGIGGDYSKPHNFVVVVEEPDEEEEEDFLQWDSNKSTAHIKVWDK